MSTILTTAEARVFLGFTTTISDLQRALLEMLLPMVDGAIEAVLHYDPKYNSARVEWYPQLDRGAGGEGAWDTNHTTAFLGSGLSDEILALRALPVRGISEIKVDSSGGFGQKPSTFGAGTILAVGTAYYQELMAAGHNATGHVRAIGGWPTEPGSIKVTYAAGYTDEELSGRATQGPTASDAPLNASGIKKAAMLTAVKAFKTAQSVGRQTLAGHVSGVLSSERLGAYSYSLDSSTLQALTGMKVSVPTEALDDLQPFVHFGLIGQ